MPENPRSRRTSDWFSAKKLPTSMLAAESSTTAGFQYEASPLHPWRRMTASAAMPPSLGATERKATKGVGAPW
jgi:hypothetical protein